MIGVGVPPIVMGEYRQDNSVQILHREPFDEILFSNADDDSEEIREC
jgi:hypothetical protein